MPTAPQTPTGLARKCWTCPRFALPLRLMRRGDYSEIAQPLVRLDEHGVTHVGGEPGARVIPWSGPVSETLQRVEKGRGW
jgi:hypothetical protein